MIRTPATLSIAFAAFVALGSAAASAQDRGDSGQEEPARDDELRRELLDSARELGRELAGELAGEATGPGTTPPGERAPELGPREQAFVRHVVQTLGRELEAAGRRFVARETLSELRRGWATALDEPWTGASDPIGRGVAVDLKGLRIRRYRLSTADQAFALADAFLAVHLDDVHRLVEARGDQVVLLDGAALADRDLARRAHTAAWGALSAPAGRTQLLGYRCGPDVAGRVARPEGAFHRELREAVAEAQQWYGPDVSVRVGFDPDGSTRVDLTSRERSGRVRLSPGGGEGWLAASEVQGEGLQGVVRELAE